VLAISFSIFAGTVKTLRFDFETDALARSPLRAPEWVAKIVPEGVGGSGALRIQNDETDSDALVRLALGSIAVGRHIHIQAQARAEGVTHNIAEIRGAQINITWRTTEGAAGVPFSKNSFGNCKNWRNVVRDADIPLDADSVTISLGLRRTTGTVWFDNLVISLGERSGDGRSEFSRANSHREWILSNSVLRLVISPTAAIRFTDLRNGRWYELRPHPLAVPIAVRDIRKTDSLSAIIEIGGHPPSRAVVRVDERLAQFVITLESEEDARVSSLPQYPYPLSARSMKDEFVIPCGSGFLASPSFLSLANRRFRGGTNEWDMRWFGLIDEKLDAGCQVIVEDYLNADLYGTLDEVEGEMAIAFKIRWLPVMGRFGHARKVLFVLHKRGGYVAMAKHYREIVRRSGEWRTLRDRMRETPDIEKMVGGIFARLVHHGGVYKEQKIPPVMSEERIRQIPRLGVSKGVLNVAVTGDMHCKYLTPGLAEWLKRRGFLLSLWVAHFVHKPIDRPDPLPLGWIVNPVLSRVTKTLVRSDGKPWNRWSDLVRLPVMCPTTSEAHLWEYINRIKRRFPIEFSRCVNIDMLCSPPQECYSREHPCTRRQDIALRVTMLKHLREAGYTVVAEGIADWAVPYVDSCYSLLSIAPFGRKMPPYHLTKHVPEYIVRRHYRDINMNPAVRVPLYDLVYHDCIMLRMHDGEANNIYHRTPEETAFYWKQKDLLEMLHGTPPNLQLINNEYFDEQKERISETIKLVCPWHEKVALREMVNHRFLTEDRLVQETIFAGGYRVIVNFREKEPYVSSEGVEIAPRSARTFDGE